MKRLKIFGLLAALVLLAFGLAVSCDSSTPADDGGSEPAYIYTYLLDGGRLALQFSQDPNRLRATETGPEEGDSYVLKETVEGGATLSFGTVTSVGNTGGSLKTIHLTPDPVAFPEQPAFNAEFSDDGGITVDSGAPVGENGAPSDAPIEGSKDDGTGNPAPAPSNPGSQGNQGGNQGTPSPGPGPGPDPSVTYYEVTFDAKGGSGAPSTAWLIEEGKAIGRTLPTPTKAGFLFGGWYVDGTGFTGAQVTSAYIVTDDIEFTAKWTSNIWAAFDARNQLIIDMQEAGESASSEITSLRADVTAALKALSLKDWVAAGQLASNYPYDAYNADPDWFTDKALGHHLYYVVSRAPNGPTFNFPSSNLRLGKTVANPKSTNIINTTIEYMIGNGEHPVFNFDAGDYSGYNSAGAFTANTPADLAWAEVELWKVAEFNMDFRTTEGTTAIRDVTAMDANGSTPYGAVSNARYTNSAGGNGFILSINPTIITVDDARRLVTVTAEDGSNVTLTKAAGEDNSAAGYDDASDDRTSTTYTFTPTSQVYTITISSDLKVEFDKNHTGGGTLFTETVARGGTIPALPIAAQGGFYFGGWYTKDGSGDDYGVEFTSATPVTESTKVYARWYSSAGGSWDAVNKMNDDLKAGKYYAKTPLELKDIVEALFVTEIANVKNWLGGSAAFKSEPYIELDALSRPTGVSLAYLAAELPGGAASSTITFTKLPTGVTVGNNAITPNPSLTPRDKKQTYFRYVIGPEAGKTAVLNVDFKLTLYPTAVLDIVVNGTVDVFIAELVAKDTDGNASSFVSSPGRTTNAEGYFNIGKIGIERNDAAYSVYIVGVTPASEKVKANANDDGQIAPFAADTQRNGKTYFTFTAESKRYTVNLVSN